MTVLIQSVDVAIEKLEACRKLAERGVTISNPSIGMKLGFNSSSRNCLTLSDVSVLGSAFLKLHADFDETEVSERSKLLNNYAITDWMKISSVPGTVHDLIVENRDGNDEFLLWSIHKDGRGAVYRDTSRELLSAARQCKSPDELDQLIQNEGQGKFYEPEVL